MFDLNMEEIMDHYKHPHNFGREVGSCHKENNPLCGDELSFCVKTEEDRIVDASFSGTGCAISLASASMLTERLKGMKLTDFRKLETEDMIKMLGIEITAVRVKCAVLSLVAARNALGEKNG